MYHEENIFWIHTQLADFKGYLHSGKVQETLLTRVPDSSSNESLSIIKTHSDVISWNFQFILTAVLIKLSCNYHTTTSKYNDVWYCHITRSDDYKEFYNKHNTRYKPNVINHSSRHIQFPFKKCKMVTTWLSVVTNYTT